MKHHHKVEIDRRLDDTLRKLSETKLIDKIEVDKKTRQVIQQLGESLKQLGKDLKENGLLGSGVNNLANEMASCVKKLSGVIEKFFESFTEISKNAWSNILMAASSGSSLAKANGQKLIDFAKTSSSKARMWAKTSTGMTIVIVAVVISLAGGGFYLYKKHEKKEQEKKMNLEIEEKINKIKQKIYDSYSNPVEFKKYFTSGQFVTELFSISNISSEKIEECKQDVINYLQSMMQFGFELGSELGFENS